MVKIVIISSPRSGSHLLAEILSHHLNLSVIYEAPFIWKRPFSYRNSDEIDTFTTENISVIRSDFTKLSSYLMKQDSTYGVIEKCPSNILRIKLVYEVFNDKIFICLHRNRNEVATSMIEKAYGNVEKISNNESSFFKKFKVIFERIKHHHRSGITLNDIWVDRRHYFNVLANIFGISQIYGPKIKNYKEIIENNGVEYYYNHCSKVFEDKLIQFYNDNRDNNDLYWLEYEDILKNSCNFKNLIRRLKAEIK